MSKIFPTVRIELLDVIHEENEQLNRFTDPEIDPFGRDVEGIEFAFKTFNSDNDQVGQALRSTRLTPR